MRTKHLLLSLPPGTLLLFPWIILAERFHSRSTQSVKHSIALKRPTAPRSFTNTPLLCFLTIPTMQSSSSRLEEKLDQDIYFPFRLLTIHEREKCNECEHDIPSHTHYIFLVHGWLGDEKENKYLDQALQSVISSSSNTNNVRFVVHRTLCNYKRTTDGIRLGGTRLANEIIQFIQQDTVTNFVPPSNNKVMDAENKSITESSAPSLSTWDHHVSLSIVGNSLGGIYGRFAISLLPLELTSPLSTDDDNNLSLNTKNMHWYVTKAFSSTFSPSSIPTLDGKIQAGYNFRLCIHPMIFCTTATPHLGVASHTYITLPRLAERAVASVLAQTGQDFFRQDEEDLMYSLATDYSRFLEPLLRFRSRIAYINAFRTDFQVPTETAGFFHRFSSYPHKIVYWSGGDGTDKGAGEEDINIQSSRLPSSLVLVLQTDTNIDILGKHYPKRNSDDDIRVMSEKLDALGWTKFIFDVRDLIPFPSIRLPWRKYGDSRKELDHFIRKQIQLSKDSSSDSNKSLMFGSIPSRDLARLLSSSERIVMPMGHTVLVANSKNDFNTYINAPGQPIMDKLAKDMIEFILTSSCTTNLESLN